MKRSPESGYSLVELMIAAAIGIVVLILIYSFFVFSSRFIESSLSAYRLKQSARHISRTIDCASVPSSCSAYQSITLNGKDGKVLVASGGSKFDEWTIKPFCPAGRLILKAAKLDAEGRPKKDPFQNTELSWQHPKSTLFQEGTLCGLYVPLLKTENDVLLVRGKSCYVNRQNELPCNPPLPAPCPAGHKEISLNLDSFGGETLRQNLVSLYGQWWIRYCKIIPK